MTTNTEKSYTVTIKFKVLDGDPATAEAFKDAMTEFAGDAAGWLEVSEEMEVTVAEDQE